MKIFLLLIFAIGFPLVSSYLDIQKTVDECELGTKSNFFGTYCLESKDVDAPFDLESNEYWTKSMNFVTKEGVFAICLPDHKIEFDYDNSHYRCIKK